jgi:hypothetical protein
MSAKLVSLVVGYRAMLTDEYHAPPGEPAWEPNFQAELVLKSDDLEFAAMGPLHVRVIGSSEGVPQMTPDEMERVIRAALKRML